MKVYLRGLAVNLQPQLASWCDDTFGDACMMQPTLLAVDDESDNLDALERIFRKRYRFLRASSGVEALALLANNSRVDVIISDQRMPQMTGVEFLEKTLTTHPKTVRILLTGYTDIDSIIAAVNQGHIFRYITKPWDTTDLSNSVEQAMDYYARGEQLEIKNQELEKALRELKILDETKSKFMILINHELKTPLTVISSFLDLLLESQPSEDQKTYLDRIKKSTDRLKEIIDDTLILTQHMAGLMKWNPQPGSLNEVLKNTLVRFNNDLHKKSIHSRLALSPEPERVMTFDALLLQRALMHLLSNAIRFAPASSEILVHTQLYPLNPPLSSPNSSEAPPLSSDSSQRKPPTTPTYPLPSMGQLVVIENDGPAIPDAVLNQLQTPFKLQNEMMNHSKGLGLGLSVVEAILQKHHSQLKIENLKPSTSENTSPNSRIRVSFILI